MSKCSTNKNVRCKTSMLRSDLCDYKDVYIVVNGRINARTVANIDINKKDDCTVLVMHNKNQ